jgi:aminoglycoside phosphotransferase (APT) family kinase protein
VSLTPGEVLGNGREAIVYALGTDRVLKVFRDADAESRARAEFDVGVLLHSAGLPVARPIEFLTCEGRPALISERIDGFDLSRMLSHAPWKLGEAVRALARVQLSVHAVVGPVELPEMHAIIEARIRAGTSIPPYLAEAALVALEALPHGEQLCHGNLHLGNVIVRDGVAALIDCGDAARGDPWSEVAQTLVRYRCARLRPGAPLRARLGSAVGRRLLRVAYLRAYLRQVSPVGVGAADRLPPAVLRRWEGVRAVERMAEGHAHERRRLLRLARRRLGLS